MKEFAMVETKHRSRFALQIGFSLLFAFFYLSTLVFFGVFSDDWDAADYNPVSSEFEFQPVDDEPEESNCHDFLLTADRKTAETVLRRTAKSVSDNIAEALLRKNDWIIPIRFSAEYLPLKPAYLSFQHTHKLFVRDGPCINLLG